MAKMQLTAQSARGIYLGQVWRKDGPFEWLQISAIRFKNSPGYDGGMPGVSFHRLGKNGHGKASPIGIFLPAETEAEVLRWLTGSARYATDS